MWRKLRVLRPSGRVWKKMTMGLMVFGVGALAFCLGRHGGSRAHADPPQEPSLPDHAAPASSNSNSDYGRRVVAYIYNNIPITREELGEYLIARLGEQRIEFLVNQKIIDLACKAQNVIVGEHEVLLELQDNLKGFGLRSAADFQKQVLSRYGKTIYEWKEDVIRPKLRLQALARPRVTPTDQDLKDAFEAHYGPKVKCRMILLPAGMTAGQMHEKLNEVRKNEQAFLENARKQFLPALADKAGEVPPIHKHFADQNMEREAFSLKPGEVSSLIELPDKTVAILRCESHVGPDTTKIYEKEREKLYKEVFATKLQQEIPKVFEELRKQAQPRFFLGQGREDITSQVQQELQQISHDISVPRAVPPALPAKK